MNEEKSSGFFRTLTDRLRSLMKEPKKLIPSAVLCAAWILLSLLSGFGANLPVLRFLYTLTYSNGGMLGGFPGLIGGILGKAVFASVLTALVLSLTEKKNPFSRSADNLKNALGKGFSEGIKGISPLLIGAGAGGLLAWLFNITSSPVNCASAVAGAIAALGAVGKKNSLPIAAIRSLTKGKTPSSVTLDRAFTGAGAGFALSFCFTFVRSPLLLFLLGLLLLAGGIALLFAGKNGTKKAAAAMLLLLTVGAVAPFSLLSVYAEGEEYEEESYEPEYVEYKGRLTYHNGAKNKHGQPFPDLMDFDRDGDIDYADRVLQHELVHNPDYLNQPSSPVLLVLVSLLSGAAGSAGGLVLGTAGSLLSSAASEAGSEAVSVTVSEAAASITLPSPITRDGEGDLHFLDPVTGKESLYKHNGDGTYTNPLTGATVTGEELISTAESRLENASLLKDDAAKAEEAIEEQRKKNASVSEYDAIAKAEKEAQAKAEKREEYLHKVGEKYGAVTGEESEIREKTSKAQAKAEIEALEQIEYADEYEKSEEYLKTVEKTADVSMDVLTEMTGRKDIKAAYTELKSTLAKGSEAYAEGKSVAVGLTQGAIEGTIDVIKDNTDGAAAKLAVNVTGEAYKEAMDATIKGENVGEAVLKGIGKGSLETSVGVTFDVLGDAAKESLGDAADDAVGTVLESVITKEGVADGVKTLASDAASDLVEDAFKMLEK